MHKLDYSYITPRPKHYKQDPISVEEFKKNLIAKIESSENTKKLVFFFDESRFGTHSKIRHCWFKKGSRSPVNVKLGFQNFYLYSSVNPRNGESFSLILLYANTVCLNVFLSEFSKE